MILQICRRCIHKGGYRGLNILIDGYRQYEDSYAGQTRVALDILGNLGKVFDNMDQDDANAVREYCKLRRRIGNSKGIIS